MPRDDTPKKKREMQKYVGVMVSSLFVFAFGQPPVKKTLIFFDMFWTCLDWRSLVAKSFERGLSKKEVSGHQEKNERGK